MLLHALRLSALIASNQTYIFSHRAKKKFNVLLTVVLADVVMSVSPVVCVDKKVSVVNSNARTPVVFSMVRIT